LKEKIEKLFRIFVNLPEALKKNNLKINRIFVLTLAELDNINITPEGFETVDIITRSAELAMIPVKDLLMEYAKENFYKP
jgi:hypothetical protein